MSKPYLYKLEADFQYENEAFNGVQWACEWGQIEQGRLTVHAGYTWDGCTPKFDVLGLVVVGTPDGRLHEGRPITYYASLVHDLLCQYKGQHPLSKTQVQQVFNDLLQQNKHPLRWLYVTATQWLGPKADEFV